MRLPVLLLAGLMLVVGCETAKPKPAPLTQADIISMVKAGMADEAIIKRIDETRTVFRLGADEVVNLRKEGVSDRVVNYMLDTNVRAAAQQRSSQPHVSFGFGYSYWGH